jgi:hypothetical protein
VRTLPGTSFFSLPLLLLLPATLVNIIFLFVITH